MQFTLPTLALLVAVAQAGFQYGGSAINARDLFARSCDIQGDPTTFCKCQVPNDCPQATVTGACSDGNGGVNCEVSCPYPDPDCTACGATPGSAC